ncbi:MAG: PssD/Cps14F family polysaccharide biosynthesis glycosyltransferase [Synechococcus sp.]
MNLLLACTSGGHFSTMYRLKAFWEQHERVWVSDPRCNIKHLDRYNEKVYCLPFQAPRDLYALLLNIPRIFLIVLNENPDLVISTGASLAVGFAIVSKLFWKKFIYIESLSRSTDLSLSGKLVYYLADEFYVQHPSLCEKYPRAKFKGYVL